MVPPFSDRCVSLPGEQILHKFKAGEFPDKTFSKLYARWLDILTLPGFIVEVHRKTVGNCYSIFPAEKFPFHSDMYCVQYDFRAQFKNIEQWMKIKKVRPGPVSCTEKTLEPQIEVSLEKGCNFASDFFLIATPSFPKYPFILSTVNQESTFIEYSENFEAAHGSKDAKLCILQSETLARNDPGLPYHLLKEIALATKKYTAVVGDYTMCEFFLLEDVPCLLTAQKRSIKGVPLSVCHDENVKTIAPGEIRGIIKRLDRTSLPDSAALSKTDQKYVFLAEKPSSEFVDVLRFAQGFIFNEGSLLCHLAVLLRERGIPSRIIKGSITEYKDGDTVIVE